MGRKKKNADFDDKLQVYLDAYELDDLNKANDLASLRQLVNFEIIIENLQKELSSLKDVATDTKKVKELNTALRDAVQSYSQLQVSLGIDRKKRQAEGAQSVLDYVEKLKRHSKTVLDKRLKFVRCDDCNLPIAKYFIYVTEKGEPGALVNEGKDIEQIKYTFRVECPRCGQMITVSNEG